ncbi:MAG TPA: hypothetical protein VFN22_03740 [Gemmatimonadales bacterium]|nr:hypothetical protein [Gemmatimonadales bacterium]
MPKDRHAISLAAATRLTTTFRTKHPDAARCWGFDRSAFHRILGQPGCEGIRIYLGQKQDGTVTPVMVGYDAKGRDLAKGEIAEEAGPCPPYCDDRSPLHGGTRA